MALNYFMILEYFQNLQKKIKAFVDVYTATCPSLSSTFVSRCMGYLQ